MDELTPQSRHIQQTLRRCAAELHHCGLLKHLASEMALRPHVFSYWVRKGRIPKAKAEWLERRFGKSVADASTLTSP